jgi:signal transduction histidine kinase
MGQLLARTPLDPVQQRMTGVINDSSDQLHGVVADLLDALDLRSGRLALAPEPVRLDTLVAEAARAAADKAAAKGLEFRLEIPREAVVELDADAARLRQVIVKLLDNAVKFTAQGAVVLSVARRDEPAGGVRLEVRDTGVGFDEVVAQRLFQAFEQADSSMSRPFGGLGLGLAICRGLVELMGGAISAQAAPGQGARFVVELPQPVRAMRAA